MKRVTATLIAVLTLNSGFIFAQEEFGEEEAQEMALQKLNEEQKDAILSTLQGALETSIEKAESEIKEKGSLMPFAYVLDPHGEGQFVRIADDEDEAEDVPPEYAFHAVQRTIVESAMKGRLVGSIVYMAIASPAEMEDLGRDLHLDPDQDISDVRLLAVEMQHLAGVGAVTFIPYWKEGDEWIFGEPQERSVDPKLRNLVRRAARAGSGEEAGAR